MIVVENICKKYKRVQALTDVSLDINEGELFGIIGPDGAGKTTLFRIMASLLLPDSGKAMVDGCDVVKDYRKLRRHIGYMPGRFSLYQDLTVEENLHFYATIFNTTIEENYEIVAPIYSQLEPFRTRRAGKLSGGMKQKLALSCALIHAPRVLLLDEPTTGVDPVSRKEFWDMLIQLKAKGITIIVSTPYLDEVRRCQRIAFINKGKVMGVGQPEEILARFSHIFCPQPLSHDDIHSQTENVIEVEHLVKAFGDFRAVDDISFSVGKGEIFGFLGANGAGKTTAMRMLCGLSQPTAGKARVAGYDVAREHEQVKLNIGYMSQRFSLYEDLTIAENMKLFGGIYGMKRSEIKARSEEMLAELGMENERNTIVGSLPLGWKQKLAFSISIFHHPKIVFLDEPTGGVDPATRRQFWQLIYRAADRGITVFVTTHYLDEAEYCDRVSIMVDGKICALDTPDNLKRQYQVDDMYGVFLKLARKAVRT